MSRILLISHIFPPAVDGGSRVIYKLGQYLESQHHQTLYLSSDCFSTDDFTKAKYKKISNIYHLRSNIHHPRSKIYHLRSKIYLPVYHHLRRPLRLIEILLGKILFMNHESYILNLIKVLQKGPIFKLIPFIKATFKIIKFKPDLIIAGPLPTTTILYANFFKKITNLLNNQSAKILINSSFHQTDPDFHQKPLIKALQQADYLWTLTQYETDYFVKIFNINPQKIILAGNGIDPGFLIKKPDQLTPADSAGESGQLNILFVGSLSAHKGLDTLINSFSLLLKANSYLLSAKLVIAGQKTLFYPEIQKIIKKLPPETKKHIKFVFNFPQEKLKNLIDSCDILVLPSHQESFGLVLIEAWARGKPVITSNIPPLAELIQKTQGGLTFKNQDTSDLAQKITQIVNSPKKRYQLGQNGFNYVKNNYTWPIVGTKICQKISSSLELSSSS